MAPTDEEMRERRARELFAKRWPTTHNLVAGGDDVARKVRDSFIEGYLAAWRDREAANG